MATVCPLPATATDAAFARAIDAAVVARCVRDHLGAGDHAVELAPDYVRWKDREWTVREGGLFDDFQVVSITRDQVSLRHGEATLVLQRRNPGD